MATSGVNQVVLCWGLKPASKCVGSGAPWEELLFKSRSSTAMTGLGPFGRNSKVIFINSFPCWTWWFVGEPTLESKARCYQYQACSCSAKAPGPSKSSCYLLAVCEPHLLEEPHAICELSEVMSQGVTRVGYVMFTRLMQIHIWCHC